MVTATQKARIIQLLKDGVGIREICRREGISNSLVYKAMKEIGMERNKMAKRKAEVAWNTPVAIVGKELRGISNLLKLRGTRIYIAL